MTLEELKAQAEKYLTYRGYPDRDGPEPLVPVDATVLNATAHTILNLVARVEEVVKEMDGWLVYFMGNPIQWDNQAKKVEEWKARLEGKS